MTRWLAALALGLSLGCNNVVQPTESPSGTVPPNSTVPRDQADTIEYRVTGNAQTVLVRFSTSVDGLSQISTTLPYLVNFKSDRQSLFLSLEAVPISTPFTVLYPFLAVQIFTNGVLFREASTTAYSTPVAVSGTWRH
jgi:hypothetical protein